MIKPPPFASPIAGKSGNITDAWIRWFSDLIAVPQNNQRTISAAYTASPSDSIIFISAGTFTLTLPVAAQLAGKIFHIFNYGAGTVTFAASSGAVKGLVSIGANAGAIATQDGINLMVYN